LNGTGGWEAIRATRPTLAPHVTVHRRDVRGEPWAMLRNTVNGEQVRLNGAALDVVLALDGVRTLAQTLERVAPDADDAVRDALAPALLTLEASGLLGFGRASDTERLVARARARRRGRFDPLALRLPLHDPDAWLSRLAPTLARVRGRHVLIVCAVLCSGALAVAFGRSESIADEIARVAVTPAHWWLYLLAYPVLKFVHELAHAVVVKRHGGAVHEAGLTLLVLMPVPYVDASDSAVFTARSARLAVGAAGLVAEATLAAASLLLWSITEPGAVHDLAFAAAVLGSIATLLFNANPLLRFDGYHLLQDLLDMPNLGTRANAWLSWLFRRHVLRARVGRSPVTGPRERRWLTSYGVASLAYRWVLTATIALYLIETVPLAGVALAAFAVYRLALRPARRGLAYLRESDEVAGHRTTAAVSIGGIALTLIGLIAFVPLPASTRIEGVLRPAAQATLQAATDGRIAAVLAAPGDSLQAGQTVLRLAAPELQGRRAVLDAELDVLQTRRRALLDADPVEAARLAADIAVARAEADALARDAAALEVRSARNGRFAVEGAGVARGRPVHRGEVLGHVVGDEALRVDAIVDQRAVGRVRAGVRDVRVRLAERIGRSLPASLVAETPAADRSLPSAALAFDGSRGTRLASGEATLRTLEPVFHLEIGLPEDIQASGVGGRAYVTLVHDPESLGRRWWRSARQLFLARLSV